MKSPTTILITGATWHRRRAAGHLCRGISLFCNTAMLPKTGGSNRGNAANIKAQTVQTAAVIDA
jgi:hypothetical protein